VLIPGEPDGKFFTNIIRGDLASGGGSFFDNVDAFLLRVQGRALLYQRPNEKMEASTWSCKLSSWRLQKAKSYSLFSMKYPLVLYLRVAF